MLDKDCLKFGNMEFEVNGYEKSITTNDNTLLRSYEVKMSQSSGRGRVAAKK